jgi:hypothetical protein
MKDESGRMKDESGSGTVLHSSFILLLLSFAPHKSRFMRYTRIPRETSSFILLLSSFTPRKSRFMKYTRNGRTKRAILHPSSFILHPSSFCFHPSGRAKRIS